MNENTYSPTPEQLAVIKCPGSAFVVACPGAGKTRTLVERARHVLRDGNTLRAIAFLSFTNAAVEELEARLKALNVLPHPIFPSFIGTFDRFLWQFFIVPFGINGTDVKPTLVPDKGQWEVVPFEKAQSLPFEIFDRSTGAVNEDLAKDEGFDVDTRNITAWETRALRMQKNALGKGLIDFDDVRAIVAARLGNIEFRTSLGAVLAARFGEVIVDESQDCNPTDLSIIEWLRESGIAVKVICDPNQSIYRFRGGVTDELLKFGAKFPSDQQLSMSGNFRSSPSICKAVVALRPSKAALPPDEALGPLKNERALVHLISYSGLKVPSTIGSTFNALIDRLGIPYSQSPVIAATRASAGNAIGQPSPTDSRDATLLLAEAIMKYHFAFSVGNRREGLTNLHRTVLFVQGVVSSIGAYHTHLSETGLDDGRWRPQIISLANDLAFLKNDTADSWLDRARTLLAPGLRSERSISQRLRKNKDLAGVLSQPPLQASPAHTIHSVKGMEFPAVCVVLTVRSAGGILDHLEGKAADRWEEDARKLYVAASRAQRFLALAVPKSRVSRLRAHLNQAGCRTDLTEL